MNIGLFIAILMRLNNIITVIYMPWLFINSVTTFLNYARLQSMSKRCKFFFSLLILTMLAGCTDMAKKSQANANTSHRYHVRGRSYKILSSSANYEERGVA